MSLIRSIDPGNKVSGTVIFDTDTGQVSEAEIIDNYALLEKLKSIEVYDCDKLLVENVASYGQPVGQEVFDTCVWIGRFMQAWHDPEAVQLVSRVKIKKYLGAKNDKEVRHAVINILRLKPIRGHNIYELKSHMFSAVAIALYWSKFLFKE